MNTDVYWIIKDFKVLGIYLYQINICFYKSPKALLLNWWFNFILKMNHKNKHNKYLLQYGYPIVNGTYDICDDKWISYIYSQNKITKFFFKEELDLDKLETFIDYDY